VVCEKSGGRGKACFLCGEIETRQDNGTLDQGWGYRQAVSTRNRLGKVSVGQAERDGNRGGGKKKRIDLGV